MLNFTPFYVTEFHSSWSISHTQVFIDEDDRSANFSKDMSTQGDPREPYFTKLLKK
jgi:hypothetical protein